MMTHSSTDVSLRGRVDHMRDQNIVTESGQRVDTIRRIWDLVTDQVDVRSDIVVVSDDIDDVLAWVSLGVFVLWLTKDADQESPHERVLVRPLAAHRDLIPPNVFVLAWIRFGASAGAEDDLPVVLRSLRPGGLAAVMPVGRASLPESAGKMLDSMSVRKPGLPTDLHLYTKKGDDAADSEHGCHFCLPGLHTLNGDVGLPGAASVLWGDNDFIVMPDIAPIVSGHLLVVPSGHHLSMANSGAYLLGRLEKQVARVERAIRAAYGCDAVFLEHGAMFPHDAGSCIDHAHWHCFPLPDAEYSVIDTLRAGGHGGSSIDLAHLVTAKAEKKSYLLVRERGENYFFPVDDAQCQFLRFHIAEATTGGTWLWHHMYTTDQSREFFMDTLDRLLKVVV